MDEKNAQTFGLFIGILITILISVLLFWFINLPEWSEYVIIIVLGIVLGTLGAVLGRTVFKTALPPLPDIQESPEQTKPVQQVQTPVTNKDAQHRVPDQQINP
jgi:uncharacterized protein YacL